MKKNNLKFASDDIIAIEELAEQLASELDSADINECTADDAEVVAIEEKDDAESVIAEAEELLASLDLPDDKKVVSKDEDAEAKEVLAEAKEVEDAIDDAERNAEADEVINDAEQIEAKPAGVCPDCGKEKCECNASEKVASEVKPGIEDKIGDEANGGDPSVSELPDTKIDCETDKEVFGQNTDSEYVAKITARLDRVATALEKRGMKKMAFRVDQLSDRLEASVR